MGENSELNNDVTVTQSEGSNQERDARASSALAADLISTRNDVTSVFADDSDGAKTGLAESEDSCKKLNGKITGSS